MPISATLSISSGVTGTLLSVEFQQLGRVEIKLSQKPRKHCIYGHRFPSYKCFWQVPRSRKLKNFKPRELPLHFAYGKDAEDRSLSNLSEDTDEMFDELFKKYGKVVFRGNDQKLPSAEVDDDVESLSYPLLVKAAKGHLVSRPPAWMMRQAGRYMAVYRKLAEKHPSFRERSETTDLIVQISLQPWEAFRPDGVIVFSDILTPLPAFGVPFDIDEMKGPVIQSPICLEEDLKALHPLDLEKLQFVGESLKILRKEVGDYAAVLGFVGAPWTIATYIIEGSTTRTYTTIKSMCHTAPHILWALLSHLTKAISEYIIFQVESGAHCIQIFDSWGGQLPPHMWELWSEPYIKEIVSLVRTKCPDTPLVLYINGNGGLLEQMKGTGVDVIGLDWTVDMADGRKRLGSDISVQGNVDPAFLFTPLPALTDEIRRVVKCAGPKGHILNLEHGVLVGTPEEAVAHFFEVVKSLKYNSSSQSLEESKLVV